MYIVAINGFDGLSHSLEAFSAVGGTLDGVWIMTHNAGTVVHDVPINSPHRAERQNKLSLLKIP